MSIIWRHPLPHVWAGVTVNDAPLNNAKDKEYTSKTTVTFFVKKLSVTQRETIWCPYDANHDLRPR